MSDLAEDLGEFAVDACWQMALETVERIQRVSPKAIRECAARLLDEKRRVVGWCLPNGKTERAGARAKVRPLRRPRAAAHARKSKLPPGSRAANKKLRARKPKKAGSPVRAGSRAGGGS